MSSMGKAISSRGQSRRTLGKILGTHDIKKDSGEVSARACLSWAFLKMEFTY